MSTITAELAQSTAQAGPFTDSIHDALSVFIGIRPRLFGIAYRVLATAADAEDIVQSVWLRWQTVDRAMVLDPAAFLSTATTRLALNAAQSAHARRETNPGPCMPEPVDSTFDPHLGAERDEALEFAVLILLENLSPNERSSYVLREAFDYPFAQIADLLRMQVANVRQLVSRARKHIAQERAAPATVAEQSQFLKAFVVAARKEDGSAMAGLLRSSLAAERSAIDAQGRAMQCNDGRLPSIADCRFPAAFHNAHQEDGSETLPEIPPQHVHDACRHP